MQQGSYLLIERGMTVRGTDSDLGMVTEVVADAGVDVFRGILVSHGLLLSHTMFVAAELVESVTDNGVQVSISKADANHLPPTALPPASAST